MRGNRSGLLSLFLRIKSNSPYRTLFEEVIGLCNAVTRRAAAERFPCLPMLAAVRANWPGQTVWKKAAEKWEARSERRAGAKHLMHVRKLIYSNNKEGRVAAVRLQGQRNSLRTFAIPFGKSACVFGVFLLARDSARGALDKCIRADS